MNDSKIFDELSYGTHFRTYDGRKFIKVNTTTNWLGWSVWFVDDYGNRNKFNAISYDGWAFAMSHDVEVEPIPSYEELEKKLAVAIRDMNALDGCWEKKVDTLNATIKKLLDNSKVCDTVEGSKASPTTDDDNLLKNKQIEPTKHMNKTTHNTLKEAVLAAISELKSAGTMSAHQITQLIRQKTNQDEWEVVGCEARANNANIKYWINHDDVRRELNELYANNELDSFGFTGRNFNGTYLEYSFDPNGNATTVSTVTGAPTGASTVQVPVPSYSPASLNKKVIDTVNSLRAVGGTVTLKRVQSALKVNGVTCKDIYNELKGSNFTLTAGPTDDEYYSQYVVA